MKTVYGPIFPIVGGGVEGSLLIGIVKKRTKMGREMEGKREGNGRKVSKK